MPVGMIVSDASLLGNLFSRAFAFALRRHIVSQRPQVNLGCLPRRPLPGNQFCRRWSVFLEVPSAGTRYLLLAVRLYETLDAEAASIAPGSDHPAKT
jgi:hypothetical protein